MTQPVAPKKSGALKWILIILVVVLLLGCCCGGTILGFLFWAKSPPDLSSNGFSSTHTFNATATLTTPGNLATLFPPDVPMFSPLTLTEKSSHDDPAFTTLTAKFTTSAKVSELVSFYKTQFLANGWENTAFDDSATSAELVYKKGLKEMSLEISTDEGVTYITKSLTTNK